MSFGFLELKDMAVVMSSCRGERLNGQKNERQENEKSQFLA